MPERSVRPRLTGRQPANVRSLSSLGLIALLVGCNQILGNAAPDTMGSGGTLPGAGGETTSGGTSGGASGGASSGGAAESGGAPATGGVATAECPPPCPGNQACVGGSCLPILPECDGQSVGTAVCSADGTAAFVCGEGLAVQDDTEPCEAFCRDGACVSPPSCVGLPTTCGAAESAGCCASPLVAGGDFNRGEDNSRPATVSDFRLDKYEVTVGRFRKFVAAMVAGWYPDAGSGKHAHLRSGLGLVGVSGEDEPGWDAAWNAGGTEYRLFSGPGTEDEWNVSLECDDFATWTPVADLNETRPVNCLNWYQAAAFCIWDGGFLPTDAEWEYAAAGGGVERPYPWGTNEPTITRASYLCMVDGSEQDDCSFDDIRKVGTLPDGDGLFGQSDLGGNMWEWALDWYVTPYAAGTCEDCANVTMGTATDRSLRSGSWESYPNTTATVFRTNWTSGSRDQNFGVRCARAP